MDVGGSRVAIAVVTIGLLAGCGGSGSDNDEAGRADNASTTVSVSTTTSLVYRTEVGVPAPPDAVVVSMDDYKFMPSTLRVAQGTFKLSLSNVETPSPCAGSGCGASFYDHDLVILDPVRGVPIARSERLAPGATGVFVVEGLQPGSYRFICTLHAQASMNGTIEVGA